MQEDAQGDLLTPEDIAFLRDLANELKTQDTYCTRKPIFFQVREFEFKTGLDPEYTDDECVVLTDDYIQCTTIQDAKDFLIERLDLDDDELISETAKINAIEDTREIEEYCGKNHIPCIRTGYEKREKLTGCFLTERACKLYLKQNGHHHKRDADTYCDHAWRNPEFQRLLEIVEKFADKGEPQNESTAANNEPVG